MLNKLTKPLLSGLAYSLSSKPLLSGLAYSMSSKPLLSGLPYPQLSKQLFLGMGTIFHVKNVHSIKQARNEVWGKVLVAQASVILLTGGGGASIPGGGGLVVSAPAGLVETLPGTATAAGGSILLECILVF